VKQRLLDTDTLSYVLKAREPVISRARAYVQQHGRLITSVISYYEIIRGLKHANATRKLNTFEQFARTAVIYPLDIVTCHHAADIHVELRRSGTLIEDADLLIAATAIANDCVLVTNNTAHYARVPGLELENWTI
jgi:tRNA(fMet)-specific endonuclease VapC